MVLTRKRAAGSPVAGGDSSGSQAQSALPTASGSLPSAALGTEKSTASSTNTSLLGSTGLITTSPADTGTVGNISTALQGAQTSDIEQTPSTSEGLPASASSSITPDACLTEGTQLTSTALLLASQTSDLPPTGTESQRPCDGVIGVASNSQADESAAVFQTEPSKDMIQLSAVSDLVGFASSEPASASMFDPKAVSGDCENGAAAASFTLPMVVSPAAGLGETDASVAGSLSKSPLQVVSNLSAAPAQQQVRYKLVYGAVSPASASSAQQPGTASTINVSLTNLFSANVSNSPVTPSSSNVSAVGSVPGAYTILAAPQNKNSSVRHIFVPICRSLSTQGAPVASLLASAPSVRPTSKSGSILSTSGSLLAELMGTRAHLVKAEDGGGTTAVASMVPLLSAGTPQLSSGVPAQLPAKALSATSQGVLKTKVSIANHTVSALASPSAVSAVSSSPGHDVMASSLLSAMPGSTASEEKETTMMWDRASTMLLLRLYKEHKTFFDSKHYKKKSVWEQIAAKLRQSRKGAPKFCWNHVENKWKNLTKKYRDCIDMNRRNGTSHKCRYYDDIAAVYSYNPEGDPSPGNSQNGTAGDGIFGGSYIATVDPAVASSLALPTKREKPSIDDEIVTNSNGDGQDPGMYLVKKKKYLKHNPQTGQAAPKPILPQPPPPQQPCVIPNNSDGGVAALLRQLREDRLRHEQMRMERLEAMHQEKMNMFSKFLDVLKQAKQS